MGAVGGTLTTLTNDGVISGGAGTAQGAGLLNSGNIITRITNSGTISGGSYGFVNSAGSAITTLTSGTGAIISGLTYYGVYNGGTITTITNGGSITCGLIGVANVAGSILTTLTNTGFIFGDAIAISGGAMTTLANPGPA